MQISWQLYAILLLNVIKQSTSCSTFCACKWKNGKQTVECGNRSLTSIPAGLDPETQVLDFSGNNLNKLTKEIFLRKQLVNLQRLYLSNCKIKTIHKDTFKGLTNLVEMDLSSNLLENVPTLAFANCPSLMKLTLNLNPINSLKKFAFNHLSYLNALELSNCEISEVEEGAFQGLHGLEWLHLDGNRMKTIRGRNTLPENVKGVELQRNAWECDCHIQDLSAWLRDFSVPLSVEPACLEPPRLKGRVIKSIPVAELACLPDVSPTMFYLELGEGKNVSMSCHVHAVPEATVSWWFQGQPVLQNNTAVAPGVHLIYFVEEGAENKHSELFIFNANAEDNGTFVCHADNSAGTTQSNFTLRIILKEDPIVIIVSFPLQYFLFVVIGITVLAILAIIAVILLIARCRRKRKRQEKREQTKEVSLQIHQHTVASNVVERSSSPVKISATPEDEASRFFYGEERLISPVGAGNPVTSPVSLRRFHLEQNPDLINGTESIGCRREGDGEDNGRTVEGNSMQFAPIACLRGSAEFYKDVRKVVDREGYPVDYGLPKLPCRTKCNEAYYRTLPCNRMKRQSAANPIKRFSREVEFLSRSVDSPYYHTDIRYTADGYPVQQEAATAQAESSFERYHTDAVAPSSSPCCSVKWPTCVPANLHSVNLGVDARYGQHTQGVQRRCASAQTDTEEEAEVVEGLSINKSEGCVGNLQNDVNEVLTESPDEGYEGEPSVV